MCIIYIYIYIFMCVFVCFVISAIRIVSYTIAVCTTHARIRFWWTLMLINNSPMCIISPLMHNFTPYPFTPLPRCFGSSILLVGSFLVPMFTPGNYPFYMKPHPVYATRSLACNHTLCIIIPTSTLAPTLTQH